MVARQALYLFGLSLMFFSMAYAQTTGGLSTPLPTSVSSPSSSIPAMTTTPLKQPASPAPPPATQPYVKRAPPAITQQSATYFHPGILVFRDGQWQGADHLLNLPTQVGVYVELVKPPTLKLDISAEEIQARVSSFFAQNRLSPVSLVQVGAPPLPMFQIKIFIYQFEKGAAAFCEVRLFESVNLNRFQLGTGMAFQAITWQRQSLVVAPSTRILEEINKRLSEMIQDFVTVYQTYEQRKQEALR